jgi:predicted metal-binding membrane protein
MDSVSAPEDAIRRDRAVVFASLGLVVAAAWAYTLVLAWTMAGAADGVAGFSHGWTAGHAAAAFVMWAVMMAAMMLPASAPMIAMVATINRSRRARAAPYAPTAVFAAGYLAVWSAFGALATAAQWALEQTGLLDATMAGASPVFAGLVLLGAGLYQATPLKASCLSQCRSPLGFLTMNWREGLARAFALGARHGAFCVGCCWALMALMFAAGTMNLLGIAALTALVLAERLLPQGERLARAVGIALTLAGLGAIAVGLA